MDTYVRMYVHNNVCCSLDTASNNNETVRKLKKIFDGFRDSAKTYAKVCSMTYVRDMLFYLVTMVVLP